LHQPGPPPRRRGRRILAAHPRILRGSSQV
ncbi:uncharacterized protein METZ01_LOCUS265450, partial [marine metagenome]